MSTDEFGGVDFAKVDPNKLEQFHAQEEPGPEHGGIPSEAVVLYHDNCYDGFGSAWAFKVLAELPEGGYEAVTYVPGTYGKKPEIEIPRFANHVDLYILDFSLKKEELIYWSKFFRKVILIDHHLAAQQELGDWWENMGRPDNVELNIKSDGSRGSGALMTWNYLNPDPPNSEPVSRLIEYISDRDLWKFALPDSNEINAFIMSKPRTFEAFSELDWDLRHNYLQCVEIGQALLEQKNRYVAEICTMARPLVIEYHDESHNYQKVTALVCNCSPQFASDVGNQLAKATGTFGGSYYTDQKGDTKFSLRSIGDFDVNRIAKSFGGGGHRNAAGFTFIGKESDKELLIFDATMAEVYKKIDEENAELDRKNERGS